MHLHGLPDVPTCLRLLESCLERTHRVAPDWARHGLAHKGLASDHPEEWLTGPVPVLRQLRLLMQTLGHLTQGRAGIGPKQIAVDDAHRTWVRVLPSSPPDRLLFRGFSAEVLMDPGVGPDQVLDQVGPAHRAGRQPGTCLILGAGNVSSIPAMDALTKLFVERRPSVVKLSPVNDWCRPYLETAFSTLIENRHLAIVSGGAEEGARLIESPEVTQVHLTGSVETHHKIVFGGSEDRRLQGRPVIDKDVSSELGNVSPVAVVPAIYKESELAFLADNIVAMMVNNAGFNCNAVRVILVAKGWHQKESLFQAIRRRLEAERTRLSYYPGSRETYEKLLEGRTDVLKVGLETHDRLPWTILRSLDPADRFFKREHFVPVAAWHELDVPNGLRFLDAATDFMNHELWGTLNATLVIPEAQNASEMMASGLNDALHRLDYGTVAINHWPALGYAWAGPPWGGAPGRDLSDPQSGLGWVHNAYLLEGAHKVVIRGPFPCWPKPIWFARHRGATEAARRLADHETRGGWWSALRVAVPGVLA
ncbi:MAG: aldehyde dehydrogenase family protein [Myxococcota bacterium]